MFKIVQDHAKHAKHAKQASPGMCQSGRRDPQIWCVFGAAEQFLGPILTPT